MKKYLFIFTFLSSSFYCFSQFNVYHPFPDSNAGWRETQWFPTIGDTCGAYNTYQDYCYSIRHDTIINGLTYHTVYISGGDTYYYYCSQYHISWLNYSKLAFCMREDTLKRIYACAGPSYGIGNRDTLLYDFNLKLGDTLPMTYNNDSLYSGCFVFRIDSILIDGNYRKNYIIGQKPSNTVVDSIIEGIGSANGLIESLLYNGNPFCTVDCFSQNDTTVYPLLNQSCQFFYLGIPLVRQLKASAIIYPNPTTFQLNVQLTNINGKVALTLYNVLGQQVMTTASEGANTVTLNVSNLSTGLYILKAQPENGEAIMQKVEIER